MRNVKIQWMILLLSILFVSLGTTAERSDSEFNFKVEFSGDEESPAIKTQAKGEVKMTLPQGSAAMTYSVVIEGIKDVVAARIHQGRKGENGPPVAELFVEPKGVEITGTLLAEGEIASYGLIGPLKGKPLRALIEIIEAGGAYVNVHTKDHPGGEIRGQIMPDLKQESRQE